MKNTISIVFKICDEAVKAKIDKIRRSGQDLRKLFIGWVMEYEIKEKNYNYNFIADYNVLEIKSPK